MDNLLKTVSQYSMTPWVRRLKYMQKIPGMVQESIEASEISDYAGILSLTEINDTIIESICIYYSLGEFGICSSGKVDWQKFRSLYTLTSQDSELLSESVFDRNHQKTIYHNVEITKNGKRVRGFVMIQTIPLENVYSSEAHVLFFIPYENLLNYIGKFADDDMDYLYLTDGSRILCGSADGGPLEQGDSLEDLKSSDGRLAYQKSLKRYISEYTKVGMDIGVVQVLNPNCLSRDLYVFLRWILAGCAIMAVLIHLVAWRLTQYSYQPLEHIMNLIDEADEDTVNEYAVIEKALLELNTEKKKRLELEMYEQNPLLEQYILHNILHTGKQLPGELEYVNTMRKYLMFRCLMLADGPEAKVHIGEIDACLAVYPQIHAAFVKEDTCFVWVLSYGEEKLAEEMVDYLQQTFQEMKYKNAVMAVSRVYEDIRALPAACREASELLRYRFFFRDYHIVQYEAVQTEERKAGNQTFEVTKGDWEKLQDTIADMDAGGAADQYEVILRRNFYDSMLTRESWEEGTVQLNEKILDMIRMQYGKLLIEPGEIIKPDNFRSLESYLQNFRIRIVNVMERCRTQENPAYAARNKMIREYVDAHLTDANLSLSETARTMHYTSTYFGKYFKDQFGCAFQQYVAERRIECAKEYLRQDPEGKKMSVSDIALSCGFTNDVTFRRTFKRYTGRTPSQFARGE